MNETTEQPHEVTPEEIPQPTNLFQRTIGVFTAPQQTFNDIARQPNWIFPLILVLVAAMIFTQILIPALLADQEASPQYQEMLQRDDVSAEDLESIIEVQQKATKNFAAVGAGVFTLIAALLASAILLFVGNIIMGGNGKFLQMFSVYCWGGLIGILGYLIRLPISISNVTMKVYLGPAILLSSESQETALFKIAAALDIFVIWRIALIAIGFAAIYKINMNKSVSIVGSLYVLMVAAGIILSGAF
jgi:hypothetical protein